MESIRHHFYIRHYRSGAYIQLRSIIRESFRVRIDSTIPEFRHRRRSFNSQFVKAKVSYCLIWSLSRRSRWLTEHLVGTRRVTLWRVFQIYRIVITSCNNNLKLILKAARFHNFTWIHPPQETRLGFPSNLWYVDEKSFLHIYHSNRMLHTTSANESPNHWFHNENWVNDADEWNKCQRKICGEMITQKWVIEERFQFSNHFLILFNVHNLLWNRSEILWTLPW